MRTVFKRGIGAALGLAAAGLAAATGMAQADVLQQIKDRGLIRLGVREGAPPFSYHDPGGAPAGLAVALCNEVAKRLAPQIGQGSLGIEYVTVSATGRFPALAEGKTDLHCGPASATLARRATLDFSILYFVDGAAAAIRPGTYDSIFDKRSGTFGYLAGTTTEAVVKDLAERNSIKAAFKPQPSHKAGLAALAAGEVDIYFGDQAILLFQIADSGLADTVAVTDEIFSFEPYALAMKAGETRLRLEVDRALSEIYDSGLIYRLILRELGSFEIPPEARAIYQIVALPQ